MAKAFIVAFLSLIGIFVIDQNIKTLFLEGYSWYGDCFSLILTFNKGVAFSMLSFLEGNLKYLQIALLGAVIIYLSLNRDVFKEYALPIGIIFGAGISNLYDRFIHGGVVDYFFWHKWFEFAVFNFADVMINIGVALILLISFKKGREQKER